MDLYRRKPSDLNRVIAQVRQHDLGNADRPHPLARDPAVTNPAFPAPCRPPFVARRLSPAVLSPAVRRPPFVARPSSPAVRRPSFVARPSSPPILRRPPFFPRIHPWHAHHWGKRRTPDTAHAPNRETPTGSSNTGAIGSAVARYRDNGSEPVGVRPAGRGGRRVTMRSVLNREKLLRFLHSEPRRLTCGSG